MWYFDRIEKKKLISNSCCMLMLTAISIVIYYVMHGSILYYDSNDYWARGQMLWQNGKFSFLNLPDGFRGYVYPLYLGICSRAGQYGFMVINSLFVSAWFVYFFPKLHICNERERNIFTDNIKCVLCFTLFMMFFCGLVIYPLSDLFAVIVCSFSVILELQIEKNVGLKKMLFSFLMGITLYQAYNVRTIYLFAGIWLFIKLLLYLVKSSDKYTKKLCAFSTTILGVLVGAFPQVYMNYYMLGRASLKVPTNGLMLAQVSWGIRYQRYDTFVGNNAMHTFPQMYFVDPVGNSLLQHMGIDVFESWTEYLQFAVSHPLDLVGIYVRHIINSMFPCWPRQYVTNLDNNKSIYAITSILIFFIFGMALLNHFINGEILKRYAALMIPILFIFAGAVEVRFFVAGYLLVIGSLCYNTDYRKIKEHVMKNRWKTSVLLILFGGVMLAMWSSMLASESVSCIFL